MFQANRNAKISLFHRLVRIIVGTDDTTTEQLPEMLFGIARVELGNLSESSEFLGPLF